MWTGASRKLLRKTCSFWRRGLEHPPSRRGFKPHTLSCELLARVLASWYGLVTGFTLSLSSFLLISSSRSMVSILRDVCPSLKHQLLWLKNKLWNKLWADFSVCGYFGSTSCCLCRMWRIVGCPPLGPPRAHQALEQCEESSSLDVSKIPQDRTLSNPIWMQWLSCFELLSCCGPWSINSLEDGRL